MGPEPQILGPRH